MLKTIKKLLSLRKATKNRMPIYEMSEGSMHLDTAEGWNDYARTVNRDLFIRCCHREPNDDMELTGWVNEQMREV